MLKLIIVDDEIFMRFGLKSTIDWNKIGYEIAGEAEDGQKALELARSTHPDVVLTDIFMPQMNGLELIKALKSEMPDTKVVVLSCNKDYEYVREAMQLWGALDYIFKLSVQPDELVNIMKKVKEIIENEKIKRNETLELQSHINSNKYDMSCKLFNDILDNNLTDINTIVNQFMISDIKIQEGGYLVICILIDDYYMITNRRNNTNDVKPYNLSILNFNSSFLNIIEKILNENKLNGYAFRRKEGEYGIIIGFGEANHHMRENITDIFCTKAISASREFLNISASFGISNGFTSLSGFCNAYREALEAAGYRIYTSYGSINYFDKIKSLGLIEYFDSKVEMHLRTILANGAQEEMKGFIFNILDRILTECCLKPSRIYSVLTEIVHAFSSVAKQYNGNIDNLKDKHGNSPLESLAYCDTLGKTRDWFDYFINEYSIYMCTIKEKMFSKDISKAVDYINKNYASKIKLKNIAEYIHMSDTYLSSLFKKETGQHFTDYLNSFRIEKAKDMLKEGNVNINEAGEMAGYASLSYFSRVFKQITGVSPIDFKNGIRS